MLDSSSQKRLDFIHTYSQDSEIRKIGTFPKLIFFTLSSFDVTCYFIPRGARCICVWDFDPCLQAFVHHGWSSGRCSRCIQCSNRRFAICYGGSVVLLESSSIVANLLLCGYRRSHCQTFAFILLRFRIRRKFRAVQSKCNYLRTNCPQYKLSYTILFSSPASNLITQWGIFFVRGTGSSYRLQCFSKLYTKVCTGSFSNSTENKLEPYQSKWQGEWSWGKCVNKILLTKLFGQNLTNELQMLKC